MKIRLLFFCFLFLTTLASAQQRLNNSRQTGYFTYIYRLNDKDMRAIAVNGSKAINDSFFHMLLDSFEIAKKYEKQLPYGNYLYVSAIKNKLNYSLVDQRNVDIAMVNNLHKLQFYVKDKKGSLIGDAKVELGNGQKVAYNKQAQLYQTGFRKKSQIIKVSHEGVSNFFEVEIDDEREDWPFFKKVAYSFPVKYTWQPFRDLFKKKYHYKRVPPKYAGYLVFSKPRYKPLDTVKFKAYVVGAKGGLIKNIPADVMLYDSNKPKKIGNVQPYNNGGYEFSFVLTDTLSLTLDRSYAIRLVEQNEKAVQLVGSAFRYEDYELKSLNFQVRTDKTTHQTGSPITIFMKATDENELTVPDGKVEMLVTIGRAKAYFDQKVFVPDTLWRKELKLDPVGETKLVLPDSIFPKANIDFDVHFVFSNSNNETRNENRQLSYAYQKEQKLREIAGKLQKDSLLIEYKENDKSLGQKATILAYSSNDVQLDSVQTTLPVLVKTNYNAEYYEVKLPDGFAESVYLTDFAPKLEINAFQNKDSLRVVVDNENKVPFWYTVFSGSQILMQGYGNRLDTLVRHSSNRAAHIRINYFWDGDEKTQETSAIYNPNYLNVKLIAPAVVYPGQSVKMLVKVTDAANEPVTATDVTAQAFTAKFGNVAGPSLPYFGKNYSVRKKKIELEADDIVASGSLKINWQKWGRALGLDTIEYYKFTHPQELYTYVEQTHDTLAQIAPFVMDKGEIDPVSLIYIDHVPVYFSQADQLQRYAFVVSPGKHAIYLRTATKLVYLFDVEAAKGTKKVISVNAAIANTDLTKGNVAVIQKKPMLEEDETTSLQKYMIKVVDNFQAEKTTLKADSTVILLNPPPAVSRGQELLVGPINENILTFQTTGFSHNFIKEPNYTYTFLPGLIKQKSYEGLRTAGNSYLGSKYRPQKQKWPDPYTGLPLVGSVKNSNDDFRQYVLKKGEIDSIWNEYLNLRSYTTALFRNESGATALRGRLAVEVDTAFKNKLPYIKNIIVYKNNEPDFIRIHPGSNPNFQPFDQGTYRILFLLKDNRYFMANDVEVKANGLNYYKWQSFKVLPADQLSKELDAYIKAAKSGISNTIEDKVLYTYNKKNFDPRLFIYQMTGRVIAASDQKPLAGASIRLLGFEQATITGVEGQFSLAVPRNGRLAIAMVGFSTKEINVTNGNIGTIVLEEDQKRLNEVVVVGYGTVKKQMLTSSVVSVSNMLTGAAPGLGLNKESVRLVLRGNRSLEGNDKALVVVDGVVVPFETMGKLNPEEVDNLTILKATEGAAIYGAMAANGVIIIKTKKGNTAVAETGDLAPQQQTMRSNFSDVGFWQPRLLTDENGNATFTVKFPDDITNWKARVIAMNGRKQNGYAETSIKSFKTLSANFVSPLFAVSGDSIKVLGKLMNYTPIEEKVSRRFVYNGKELANEQINVKNSHIDTLTIAVNGTDSLRFEYTLKQENGYFDGEARKLPVAAAGVKETKGYFAALLRDTTISYAFDKKLGNITLRAEASVFPTLLDEMTKLRNYEYLCNEQLASKLKALLLEKKVRAYLNEPFKHEKDINTILKKLKQNRTPQCTWGWWPNSNEEMWISLHATEALLEAEKAGYPSDLDKKRLYAYLANKMAMPANYGQLAILKLIYLLDDKNYIKDWVLAIEKIKTTQKPVLYDRLQLMRLKQLAGLKVNVDSLLAIKKETMFGNAYWGEENSNFWDNSIQNTILAYQILKAAGQAAAELDKLQRYFLEQRKDGQWRNTYESSLILETILPELLVANQKQIPTAIKVNQETISKFPFSQILSATDAVTLSKTGGMPVYFTAYQQFQNTKPEKMGKDFTVNTSFVQKGASVRQLKAGTLAALKVEVEVRADADYVMIEIPIPAGCSYENKLQSFWGVETHREYFKEKTSIFCTKLKQGKYTFTIDLMPRYSGSYVLNPAKVEMMYFPVFFGREGIKKVGIN